MSEGLKITSIMRYLVKNRKFELCKMCKERKGATYYVSDSHAKLQKFL